MRSQPTPVRPKLVTPAQRQRQLLYLVFVVLIVFLVFRACAHSDTKYEHDARIITEAIEKNDSASIGPMFNADAREQMNRQRFGKASDDFAGVGKINSVREISHDDATRTHVELVAGAKGNVTEHFRYDIDGKIDRFRYDPVEPAK
jgi:hypothetical protein